MGMYLLRIDFLLSTLKNYGKRTTEVDWLPADLKVPNHMEEKGKLTGRKNKNKSCLSQTLVSATSDHEAGEMGNDFT